MNHQITIVDHGRGPQLSTSRITVHDLVPYFQDDCSYDEIIRCVPTLTHREIEVVDRYYRDHQAELDEHERRVRAHRAERLRAQRIQFPDDAQDRRERLSRLRVRLPRQRPEGKHGEGNHR